MATLQSRDAYDYTTTPPSIGADLDSELDYSRDWTIWLDGDTIQSFNAVFADGVKQGDTPSTHTSTSTVIWAVPDKLSAKCKAGNKVRITHRIETVGGRKEDYSVDLKLGEY
jgi:hypothetical protein